MSPVPNFSALVCADEWPLVAGKFTHSKKFRLAITCLDYLAQFAQVTPTEGPLPPHSQQCTAAGHLWDRGALWAEG